MDRDNAATAGPREEIVRASWLCHMGCGARFETLREMMDHVEGCNYVEP